MEVLRPKKLEIHKGDDAIPWAQRQLELAREILDNPGGGLLFATQTIGQVRAALQEQSADRWAAVITILERAEDQAVHREFDDSRQLLAQAIEKLSSK